MAQSIPHPKVSGKFMVKFFDEDEPYIDFVLQSHRTTRLRLERYGVDLPTASDIAAEINQRPSGKAPETKSSDGKPPFYHKQKQWTSSSP